MSYIPVSTYVTEALMWALLGFFSFGIVLLFSFVLIGLVEEWSYGKKQSGNTDANSDPVPSNVGGDVVRTRPRRVSLSPWVK